MRPDRDAASLDDITTACKHILEFIADVDQQSFIGDYEKRSAVIHQLLIIGEATKRLSSELCSKYEEVPWSVIARTRDILIHHYEGVDFSEVWRIAKNNIPELLTLVNNVVSDLRNND